MVAGLRREIMRLGTILLTIAEAWQSMTGTMPDDRLDRTGRD
jgi:hypothetical protein